MTETDWLASHEPTRMWRHVQRSAAPRKVRLLCAGCARRALPPDPPPPLTDLLALVESLADHPAPPDATYYRLMGAVGEMRVSESVTGRSRRAVMAVFYAAQQPARPGIHVSDVFHEAAGAADDADVEYAAQADLVRCVFGNTPKQVEFEGGWRTEAVVGLARGMYESRDFGPMPVLADALEDAGCVDEDILTHCRGPEPHVRGCVVLDAILGKA